MSLKNNLNNYENGEHHNAYSSSQCDSFNLSINEIPVCEANQELIPWIKIVHHSRGASKYDRIE